MKTRPRFFIFVITGIFLLSSTSLLAVNVTIIESETSFWWAGQDTMWRNVAVGMGYTATVVPQSTLDDLSSLDNTDLLIVASSAVSYSGTNHVQTIVEYVLSGRPAYIQSEYLGTFQGNITFDSIMQAVGADFSWTGTINGQLVPMNVLGAFATTPDSVPTLDYFNYGYTGSGADVDPFLEYQGNNFGFFYCASKGGSAGGVVTVTDEDWAWQNASPGLMKNIIYQLLSCFGTGTHEMNSANDQLSIYPNPSTGHFTLACDAVKDGDVRIEIMNLLGQKVYETTTRFENGMGEVYLNDELKGIFLVEIFAGKKQFEEKVVIK